MLTTSLLSKSRLLCKLDTVHSTRERRHSNLNTMYAMTDTFTFVVSDRVAVKKEADGSVAQFFTVYARGSNDKTYPKVERTYRDFKSLEVALNNNLRSNDIECPQLESDSFMSDIGRRNEAERDPPLTEKINNIRRFCKEISQDPALQVEPFFDFFKIPKADLSEPDHRLSEVDL